MTRIAIVDTNVVVAGLLTDRTDSPVWRILSRMIDGSMVFLLSPDLLAEYNAVLQRPAIAKRHGLDEDQIEQILVELTGNAIWIEPVAAQESAPDLNDSHLWAMLEAYPIAVLVTGDKLLIENAPVPSSVVSPSGWVTLAQME